MSILESHDYDLINYKEKCKEWEQIETHNFESFQEMLDEAFSFINNESEDDTRKFEILKASFREYFDKCDIVISQGYKFQQLFRSA